MERGGAKRRSDIINAAFIDFMKLCNEKMLFPKLQMICGVASVIFCILSVLLLAYEKPLAYLKDNLVCLCAVLFCICPILGISFIKFKTKWHIIFPVVTYCARAGAFFLLKEKDRKIKQAAEERERANMDQKLGSIEDLYEESKGGSPNSRREKIDLQAFQRLGASITDFRETYFQQKDGLHSAPTDGVE